ncbi:MAG: hypothetical protein AAFO75_04535, partial [Pseudomonadota bacterium]
RFRSGQRQWRRSVFRVFVVTIICTFGFALAGFFTTLEAQRLAAKTGLDLSNGYGLISMFLPFLLAIAGAVASGILGATYGWKLARSW